MQPLESIPSPLAFIFIVPPVIRIYASLSASMSTPPIPGPPPKPSWLSPEPELSPKPSWLSPEPELSPKPSWLSPEPELPPAALKPSSLDITSISPPVTRILSPSTPSQLLDTSISPPVIIRSPSAWIASSPTDMLISPPSIYTYPSCWSSFPACIPSSSQLRLNVPSAILTLSLPFRQWS